LRVCRALLRVCRALLRVCRALLSVCSALLDDTSTSHSKWRTRTHHTAVEPGKHHTTPQTNILNNQLNSRCAACKCRRELGNTHTHTHSHNHTHTHTRTTPAVGPHTHTHQQLKKKHAIPSKQHTDTTAAVVSAFTVCLLCLHSRDTIKTTHRHNTQTQHTDTSHRHNR